MQRIASLVLVTTIAACGRAADTPESAANPDPAHTSPPSAGWMVTEDVDTPESAYFDPESGFIFASQIAGLPTDRDGRGRIIKLHGNGTVVSATWVTGLNAPKGLRSHRGTLWAADIDEVVGIEIATGRITSRIQVPGAQFLNDVACGPDGTVYVSDMLGNRIYAIANGQVSVLVEGEHLEYPNGLLVDGGRLVVGAWGRPEADFTTKVPGRLFALDLQTKEKTLITPMPFANIDGVESDGEGGYLVSDYLAGTILRVSPAGESHLVRQLTTGTADIGFIPSIDALIVPHMNENAIAAYDISDALR